jgi:hypothetical protein
MDEILRENERKEAAEFGKRALAEGGSPDSRDRMNYARFANSMITCMAEFLNDNAGKQVDDALVGSAMERVKAYSDFVLDRIISFRGKAIPDPVELTQVQQERFRLSLAGTITAEMLPFLQGKSEYGEWQVGDRMMFAMLHTPEKQGVIRMTMLVFSDRDVDRFEEENEFVGMVGPGYPSYRKKEKP